MEGAFEAFSELRVFYAGDLVGEKLVVFGQRVDLRENQALLVDFAAAEYQHEDFDGFKFFLSVALVFLA